MNRHPFAVAALATFALAGSARAQRMAGTLVDSAPGTSVDVAADSAHFVVRHGARSGLEARLPVGTFVLRADSATLASWADQAELLPPVSRRTPRDPRPLAGVLVRSTLGSDAMRLARLPAAGSDDTTAAYRLEATNGAWVGMTRLSPEAFARLNEALHGRTGASSPPTSNPVYLEFRVDRPAMQIDDAGGRPEYPEGLRKAKLTGKVQMEYIVDTTGRVEPASVRLLAATAPEFARAVHDAMRGMRFQPALVAGRPVRMVVQQAFEFNLQ